ncbi:MAG: type II secretion system protein [Burkholderiaceae bacterium]
MPRFEATRSESGFTLVEAVMVIAIVGVLAAVVSRFIVPPVQAYASTQARAALLDQADLALRRIGRDLRIALPNSARVSASGLALELIPSSGAARYRTEGANRLQFGTLATSFDLIGPPLNLGASQNLVFYNLGPGVGGSDAYAANGSAAEQADSNRRISTTAAGVAASITMSSLAGLPVADFAPPYRVFAVEPPVSYRCDLASGTLTRFAGYGFFAAQPDPPPSASGAVLASGVTACRFSADAAVVAARAALVNLALTLTATTPSGSESVTLHHAVHIDNLP